MAKSTKKQKRARKRHAKSCEGKHQYPNAKAARASAEVMRERHNQHTIQAYECQSCGGWHLGRRSW